MEKQETKRQEKTIEAIVKQKPKQVVQTYTAEEYALVAESVFQTKAECVKAAFLLAGKERATEEEAKKLVKEFLEMEV